VANNTFDAVVVGGGPAGCAAALHMAGCKLRVAILEDRSFPRDRPGETLPPAIEPVLQRLGIQLEGATRYRGHWVEQADQRFFLPHGQDASGHWQGFHIWRADFDEYLLRCALREGVEVYQPCRALRPLCSGGKVVGVVSSSGELRCQFLIDAAGGRHWLAQHLGLSITRNSPKLIAAYNYHVGSLTSFAPSFEMDATGWTWLTQLGPELFHWTRLNWSGAPPASDWAPQRMFGLEPRRKALHADVTWRMVTPASGPGYYLVGDAAFVIDPAASHGVLKAVMTGMMAGFLVGHQCLNTLEESTAFHDYNGWIANWFSHDTLRLREHYASLASPPDWSRGH